MARRRRRCQTVAAIAGRGGAWHHRAMTRADLSAPRRARFGVAAVVLLLHLVAVLALVRAFAPDFTDRVAEQVLDAVTVTITAPPSPPPSAAPPAPEPAGAEGEAGRKATPREAAAPPPKIRFETVDAPPVAGKGADNASGARDAGSGTGAGGQGSGTGAGGQGSGAGGGAAKAVKIAGDINSTRDYPAKSRELRLGDHVIVALRVGTDGRVKGCRVVRPSRDADADAITCRLATDRFRFRPATDANGEPAESEFGWRQRWYDPRPKAAASEAPAP